MIFIPDFLILLIIYFLFFFGRWKAKGKDIFVCRTLMYIYLSFVAFFTVMPVFAHIPMIAFVSYTPMNLYPFEDLIFHHSGAVSQFFLNILMTVPFGILYPMSHRKKKLPFLRTVISVFVLSLFIELIQPIISLRTSDITDIITNTVGGILGYIIYFFAKPIGAKILNKIKHE